MTIDKATAKALSAEVEKALAEVAKRHGLTVAVKGGTYDSGMYRPKVEFSTDDRESAEFTKYAHLFGLAPEDFGREFVSGGRTFKISGLAMRSSVRPILAVEVATGRTFKFTDDAVKAAVAA